MEFVISFLRGLEGKENKIPVITDTPIIPWLNQIIDILVQRGLANAASIQGCTATEIAEIAGGNELPARYREFLEAMGRGAGRFFTGTDMFYPSIVGLTDEARNMVSEDASGIVFPQDGIAVGMHQGYEFMFVCSSDGDDPPVYYYMEASGEFQRKYSCFSEYLINAAHDDW